MKVNLLYHSDSMRSGYVNVDPFAEEGSDKVKLKLDNLDEVASNAECTDLVAVDVLDHYNSFEVDKVLDHWVRKLRKQGTLTVGGMDLTEVTEAL